jgi:hypothetical protein
LNEPELSRSKPQRLWPGLFLGKIRGSHELRSNRCLIGTVVITGRIQASDMKCSYAAVPLKKPIARSGFSCSEARAISLSSLSRPFCQLGLKVWGNYSSFTEKQICRRPVATVLGWRVLCFKVFGTLSDSGARHQGGTHPRISSGVGSQACH